MKEQSNNTVFHLYQGHAHSKNRACVGNLPCLVMSLVFFAAGCRPPSTQDSPVAETMPGGEQSNMDDVTTEYALTTEFALRKAKSILGMTRQSVEREIGLGELALTEENTEENEVYRYPMLYDASLVIEYENNRAAELSIIGDADESAAWVYRRY